jgi:hypothetical protein
MGGGIQAGLLLWFGAIHEHRKDDVHLVRTLYENRLSSTFWSHSLKSWPGPIARFFLEQIDEQHLIADASDRITKLCDAHFAAAIRARELGRNAAYQKHLRLAAPVRDPSALYDFYNEFPYFIAKHEADKSRR